MLTGQHTERGTPATPKPERLPVRSRKFGVQLFASEIACGASSEPPAQGLIDLRPGRQWHEQRIPFEPLQDPCRPCSGQHSAGVLPFPEPGMPGPVRDGAAPFQLTLAALAELPLYCVLRRCGRENAKSKSVCFPGRAGCPARRRRSHGNDLRRLSRPVLQLGLFCKGRLLFENALDRRVQPLRLGAVRVRPGAVPGGPP